MLNLGLPGLQAVHIAERDGDGRSPVGEVAPRQPDNNRGRPDGNQPYPAERLGPDSGAWLLVSLFATGLGGAPVFGGLSHSISVVASHMSRESNTMVANMVMITTAAKATRPAPACTAVNEPNWSTATSIATEKISMLDQRPIVSMVRYNWVRLTRKRFDFTRVATSIQVSPNSLTSGRMILAVKTMTASGHRSL